MTCVGPWIKAANTAYAAVGTKECVTGHPTPAPAQVVTGPQSDSNRTGEEDQNGLATAAAAAAKVPFVALSAAGWAGCASTETGTAAAELVERSDAMEAAVAEPGSQGEVAVDLATAWEIDNLAALCECLDMPLDAYPISALAPATATSPAPASVVSMVEAPDEETACVAVWREEIGEPPGGNDGVASAFFGEAAAAGRAVAAAAASLIAALGRAADAQRRAAAASSAAAAATAAAAQATSAGSVATLAAGIPTAAATGLRSMPTDMRAGDPVLLSAAVCGLPDAVSVQVRLVD